MGTAGRTALSSLPLPPDRARTAAGWSGRGTAGTVASRFGGGCVSRAARDRPAVARRAEMLPPPVTDIEACQSTRALDPAGPSEPVPYRRIDECDIFLLFWSN